MSLDDRSNSAEIFQAWDLYDRVIRLNYMKHREMAGALARAGRMLSGQCRVLDLGCGDGRMAATGLVDVACDSYHGIDLSGQAIEAARSNVSLGNRVVCFTQGDLAVTGAELAELWRHGRAEPANLLLASYSLHHLQLAELAQLLKSLGSAMDSPGLFCWIDLCTLPGEDRQSYLRRFFGQELMSWDALTPADVSAVKEHMGSSDFPLSESLRIEVAAGAGFRLTGVLYQDEFYAAHLFELGA